MKNLWYAFIAVLVVISTSSVIFCIVRGKGVSHKRLVFFASTLGVVAMICFGGQAVLSHFGMGWRCTPLNIMLVFCATLFIATLWCGIRELSILKGATQALRALAGCGFISMVLLITVTLISTTFYFQFSSWHDGLCTYNDQTIVYANDEHGGSCSWRYYTHINGLVHGAEITQDGWWGYPPFKS